MTLSPLGASMKVLDTPYQTLDLRTPAPGVVVVTLNRPERYNAKGVILQRSVATR
jgi:hypothetical protein